MRGDTLWDLAATHLGDGARFRRAYSTCPSCIPARLSLLTGLHPSTSGLVGYAPFPIKHPTFPALLAEAGITPDNFPKLELSFWSGPALPEALQAMWKAELGLTIVLAQREARVHLSSLATGNYDIGFINAIPDVADATNILADFTVGASENFPHWNSPAYDAALLRNDPVAAESILLESAPLTPVYFNSKIFLMSPRVHGWREDGLWSPDFTAVSLTP